MSNPVVLSTSSLWSSSPFGVSDLEWSSYIQAGLMGLEIHLSFAQIDSWCDKLQQGEIVLPQRTPNSVYAIPSLALKHLILSPHTRIHLDDLKNLPVKRRAWLFDQLKTIYAITGINKFLMHPDEVSIDSWRSLVSVWPEHLELSFENMDLFKKSFKSLGEAEDLLDACPKLSMTFDLCHWLELGKGSDDPELVSFFERYQERISTIHFSVPESESAAYDLTERASCRHFLWSESNLEIQPDFFALLPSNAPLVLEGMVPARKSELLTQEISLLSQGLYQDVKRQAA